MMLGSKWTQDRHCDSTHTGSPEESVHGDRKQDGHRGLRDRV